MADLQTVAQRAAAIADEGPIEIAQDDTFFKCSTGRLKLRTFAAGNGELIFYQRASQTGPKESFYLRTPTTDPDTLRESLSLAFGVVGRVVKRRLLFLAGRTRIHLDQVEGLGEFIELEVVLQEGDAAGPAVDEAHALMRHLGIRTDQLIEDAYIDLQARKGNSLNGA